jgi:hypothetical protein
VFDKHDHLFLRDEAFERQDFRDHPIPKDTTRNGEEILHEVALRSHLYVDGAVAKTGISSRGDIETVSLHSFHGILKGDKLDVGIHRLAGHLVHDDMHAFVRVIQDLGVATEKGNDFGASRGERNSVLCHRGKRRGGRKEGIGDGLGDLETSHNAHSSA